MLQVFKFLFVHYSFCLFYIFLPVLFLALKLVFNSFLSFIFLNLSSFLPFFLSFLSLSLFHIASSYFVFFHFALLLPILFLVFFALLHVLSLVLCLTTKYFVFQVSPCFC